MFWKYNWPAIAWAVLILILCGLPGDKFPELTFLEWLNPDKIAHLVLFGVQCFLLIKGFQKQYSFPFFNKNAVLSSIIISIAYGCSVEILQEYVFIHRSGDIRDAAANALGVFLGLWAHWKTKKILKNVQ